MDKTQKDKPKKNAFAILLQSSSPKPSAEARRGTTKKRRITETLVRHAATALQTLCGAEDDICVGHECHKDHMITIKTSKA